MQLADTDIRFIRKHFNVVLKEPSVNYAAALSRAEELEFAPVKQEIICSRSFGHRITEYKKCAVPSVVTLPGCRETSSGTSILPVYLRLVKTSPFAPDERYYANNASVTLLTPTQDSRDIIAAATRWMSDIWLKWLSVPESRGDAGDFYSQGVAQLNLFDENAPRKIAKN